MLARERKRSRPFEGVILLALSLASLELPMAESLPLLVGSHLISLTELHCNELNQPELLNERHELRQVKPIRSAQMYLTTTTTTTDEVEVAMGSDKLSAPSPARD